MKQIFFIISVAFFCNALYSDEVYPRPLPLRTIAVEKIFLVSDFGAKPDDGVNDLPAISAALAEAGKVGRPSEVRFTPGAYHLKVEEGGANPMCLTVEGARDLLIEGSGASFIVQSPDRGFLNVSKCTNVIVRNLSIDYDPLPFSQGMVKAVNDLRIDVEIDAGYPSLAEPRFANSWGMVKDPKIPGRLKSGAYDWFATKAISNLGGNLFRLEQVRTDFKSQIEVGDRYVQNGRKNAAKTFGTGLSESVTFERVTIYSSPGASYVGWFGSLINVIGCRTILKPGRWQTTGADGVHVQSQRIGPWIEGCVFEGIADDGVNIYTRILPVKAADGNGIFIAGVPPNARPGDRIAFFSQVTGAAPKVFSLRELVDKGSQMRFEELIPNEPPLVEPGAWQIYNTSLAGNGYVIVSNTFKDSRRYGLLIKASHGLVEGNTFDGLSASAITLRNIDNVEGLQCEDVLIRRNLVSDCGFDAEYKKSTNMGLVALGLYQKGNAFASWQGQKNIRIVENRFESRYPRSISIRSASEVSILSNRFAVSENAFVSPIVLSNASKVVAEDNLRADLKSPKSFVEADLSVSELRLQRNR